MTIRATSSESYELPFFQDPQDADECPQCREMATTLRKWRQVLNQWGAEIAAIRECLEVNGVVKIDGVDVVLGSLTNGNQLTYNSTDDVLELGSP